MTTISFASFNLYNFQEAGKKIYKKTVTQQEYAEKLAWTSEMLKLVNADVFAFQELWSWKCLSAAFEKANLSDEYTLVYLSDLDEPKWRGIAVAVAIRKKWTIKTKNILKKFPFENIVKVDHDDDEDDEINLKIDRFSRSIINLELEKDNRVINVYAAHLKAKLPTRTSNEIPTKHQGAIGSAISTIRRTAEAAALRWELTNVMKNKSVATVLIGDLNDDPRSNTLAILTEQPSMTSSSRGRDTALYSALQLQQLKSFRDVFYTHEFNRLKDTLDHILVSEQFFSSSNDAEWRHESTKVWNDFIEDESSTSSDHGIIKATFEAI
jgi:endonuclease/exonuclease/phosphatase family metal-dependent hydrolase